MPSFSNYDVRNGGGYNVNSQKNANISDSIGKHATAVNEFQETINNHIDTSYDINFGFNNNNDKMFYESTNDSGLNFRGEGQPELVNPPKPSPVIGNSGTFAPPKRKTTANSSNSNENSEKSSGFLGGLFKNKKSSADSRNVSASNTINISDLTTGMRYDMMEEKSAPVEVMFLPSRKNEGKGLAGIDDSRSRQAILSAAVALNNSANMNNVPTVGSRSLKRNPSNNSNHTVSSGSDMKSHQIQPTIQRAVIAQSTDSRAPSGSSNYNNTPINDTPNDIMTFDDFKSGIISPTEIQKQSSGKLLKKASIESLKETVIEGGKLLKKSITSEFDNNLHRSGSLDPYFPDHTNTIGNDMNRNFNSSNNNSQAKSLPKKSFLRKLKNNKKSSSNLNALASSNELDYDDLKSTASSVESYGRSRKTSNPGSHLYKNENESSPTLLSVSSNNSNHKQLKSASVKEGDPQWYVKVIMDKKLVSGKHLVALLKILKKKSKADFMQTFLEHQGHVVLGQLLSTIAQKSIRTNQDLEWELIILNCYKAIANNSTAADIMVESPFPIKGLVFCLVSPRLSTRKFATEILALLSYANPPIGRNNILNTMKGAVKKGHLDEELIFQPWLSSVEKSLDSPYPARHNDQAFRNNLNLHDYSLTTVLLIISLVEGSEDLKERIKMRNLFKVANVEFVFEKMRLLHHDVTDQQIDRYLSFAKEDYEELIHGMDNESLDGNLPTEKIVEDLVCFNKGSERENYLSSIASNLLLISNNASDNNFNTNKGGLGIHGKPPQDNSEVTRMYQLIDSVIYHIVNESSTTGLDSENVLSGAIQRIMDRLQTDDTARRAVLETKELNSNLEEVIRERNILKEQLRMGSEGRINELVKIINNNESEIKQKEAKIFELREKIDSTERQRVIDKERFERKLKTLSNSAHRLSANEGADLRRSRVISDRRNSRIIHEAETEPEDMLSLPKKSSMFRSSSSGLLADVLAGENAKFKPFKGYETELAGNQQETIISVSRSNSISRSGSISRSNTLSRSGSVKRMGFINSPTKKKENSISESPSIHRSNSSTLSRSNSQSSKTGSSDFDSNMSGKYSQSISDTKLPRRNSLSQRLSVGNMPPLPSMSVSTDVIGSVHAAQVPPLPYISDYRKQSLTEAKAKTTETHKGEISLIYSNEKAFRTEGSVVPTLSNPASGNKNNLVLSDSFSSSKTAASSTPSMSGGSAAAQPPPMPPSMNGGPPPPPPPMPPSMNGGPPPPPPPMPPSMNGGPPPPPPPMPPSMNGGPPPPPPPSKNGGPPPPPPPMPPSMNGGPPPPPPPMPPSMSGGPPPPAPPMPPSIGGKPPAPGMPSFLNPGNMNPTLAMTRSVSTGELIDSHMPKPNKKLKQIHWDKVDDVNRTFWADKADQCEMLDELSKLGVLKEVETYFPAKESKIKIKSKQSSSDKNRKISFLKRDLAQQFGINLHAYASYSEMELIGLVLRCDKQVLTNVNVLEFFNKDSLNNIPDSLIRNFKPYGTNYTIYPPTLPEKNPEELERPDRVYLELCYNLHHYWKSRSRALLVCNTYAKDHTDLEAKLENLDLAIEAVKDSSALKDLLDIIRSLGNFMNDIRKQVKGFKIGTLQRLKFMKDDKNTMTFLHYIERVVRTYFPNITEFVDDLENVTTVANLSIEQLENDCNAYDQQVRNIEQSTRKGNLSDPKKLHPDDRILMVIAKEIPRANTKATILMEHLKTTIENYNSLMSYFGENIEDVTARNTFFQKFSNFIQEYKKAHIENIQREEEQRAYEVRKRLIESRMANKSKPKHKLLKEKPKEKYIVSENNTADNTIIDRGSVNRSTSANESKQADSVPDLTEDEEDDDDDDDETNEMKEADEAEEESNAIIDTLLQKLRRSAPENSRTKSRLRVLEHSKLSTDPDVSKEGQVTVPTDNEDISERAQIMLSQLRINENTDQQSTTLRAKDRLRELKNRERV